MSHFHESGNISALHVVHIAIFFLTILNTLLMNVGHNLVELLVNLFGRPIDVLCVLSHLEARSGDVRGNFNVGTPSGVTWTVSDPVVEIKGNDAYVTDRSTAEVSLTATCGNFSRQWTVKLNSASGIDGVDADKAIVGVTYFNVGGMEVTAPANHDGQTYIVVRRYSDGSVKAQKMIDK